MMETRWQNVKTLFAEALQRKATERSAFLDEACSGAPALRIEVEELLRAHERAANDFALPAAEVFAPLLAENFNLNFAGQKLGAFRLEDELGRGGMGVVYRAQREDGEFEQKVAIKILQTRSAEFLRRFRHERQTLAALNHPNIARLYDGGVTTEGSPYFVMEYVAGHALHDYCKSHGADLHARLLLFLQICEAVRYAHQHSIVHRDLKPGNILVNKEGVPKLLDFGIAKLLQPHGVDSSEELTLTGFQPMTLPYASPEQVRNEIISTVSDVYALGVILYELLAGRRPYDFENASPVEIARIICEVEPKKPSEVVDRGVYPRTNESEVRTAGTSTLRQQLAGDLDSIVLKALRKEPEQRYSSVEQLAEDLRRHLDGRPMHARKGTWSYRANRFVRRHKYAVAATFAFFALLLSFGIFTQVQANRIALERDKAEQVSKFLVEIFQVSDPNEAKGDTITAREVLERGAEKIDRDLKDQPEVQTALMLTLGGVYRNLGLYDRAIGFLKNALELRQKLHGEGNVDVAAVLYEYGTLQYQRGDFEAADSLLRKCVLVSRQVLGEKQADLIGRLNTWAIVRYFRGDFAHAEKLYREALAKGPRLLGEEHVEVGSSRNNLATLLHEQGRYDEAEPLYSDALGIYRKQFGNDHSLVAVALNNLAVLRRAQGNYTEAETLMRESLAIRRKILPPQHPETGGALFVLGLILINQHRSKEAEPLLHECLESWRKFLPPDNWMTVYAENSLGNCLTLLGRFHEAEALLLSSYPKIVAAGISQQDLTPVNALNHIIALYQAWDKPAQAAEYRALLPKQNEAPSTAAK